MTTEELEKAYAMIGKLKLRVQSLERQLQQVKEAHAEYDDAMFAQMTVMVDDNEVLMRQRRAAEDECKKLAARVEELSKHQEKHQEAFDELPRRIHVLMVEGRCPYGLKWSF